MTTSKDGKLKVKLVFEDGDGNVKANVEQELILPGIYLPSFLPGAYNQVEQMLNLVGIDYFKMVLRDHFMSELESIGYARPMLGDSVGSASFVDEKMVIDSGALYDLEDESQSPPDETNEESMVIDLPVEQENEEDKDKTKDA